MSITSYDRKKGIKGKKEERTKERERERREEEKGSKDGRRKIGRKEEGNERGKEGTKESSFSNKTIFSHQGADSKLLGKVIIIHIREVCETGLELIEAK